MSKVRDLPPVSGSIIWARQVSASLTSLEIMSAIFQNVDVGKYMTVLQKCN